MRRTTYPHAAGVGPRVGQTCGLHLHRSLRTIIKIRGVFPSDEVATKLLYLPKRSAGIRWKGLDFGLHRKSILRNLKC